MTRHDAAQGIRFSRIAPVTLAIATLAIGWTAGKAMAQPAVSWTGCYIGANAGGGWAGDDLFNADNGTYLGSRQSTGWLGGGQFGCDHQFGSWVVGATGSASLSGLNGSSPLLTEPAVTVHHTVNQLGTVTGRLGYAAGRHLLYVDGGFAWANSSYREDQPSSSDFIAGSSLRSGWAIGAGVEYALDSNWSLKLDYNHLDFGTSGITLICHPPSTCGGDPSIILNQALHIDTVTIGINYRFGASAR